MLGSFGNLLQIGAAHSDIDVFCEASSVRLDFLDV